jgi:hypothetical protein
VDIEAEGVEEVDESVKTRADAAFKDITPVVEAGLTQAYPALDQPYKRRRARKIMLGVLALVLLVGLGAGLYWGLPQLRSQDSTAPDAGAFALAPASRDAGTVAQEPASRDAGVAVKPADNGKMQAKDEGKKPEPRVARVKPVGPRKPPRKVIKLTRRGVEKILRRNGGRLQGCADTHLPHHSGGSDVSLELGFTIMGSGKVEKANLKPAKLESTPFGKCMLARVRRIKFPRHQEKSVTVSFPLKFQAIKR